MAYVTNKEIKCFNFKPGPIGMVVEIINERLYAGYNNIETSLEDFPANLYIVELQTEGGRFLHKLVIE
jgi:hypothetical protein